MRHSWESPCHCLDSQTKQTDTLGENICTILAFGCQLYHFPSSCKRFFSNLWMGSCDK